MFIDYFDMLLILVKSTNSDHLSCLWRLIIFHTIEAKAKQELSRMVMNTPDQLLVKKLLSELETISK